MSTKSFKQSKLEATAANPHPCLSFASMSTTSSTGMARLLVAFA